MRRGLLFSLALHAAVAAFLLAGAWLFPASGPKAPPVVAEVELVEQNTPAVGTTAAAEASTPQPAAAEPMPQPLHASEPVRPPRHAARPASLPLPPPPLPARPGPRRVVAAGPAAAPVPPQESSRPGESGSSGTGLVSGDQIIPAALDRAVRNVPPAYPPQAVREGEQGSVLLRVHIAPDGTATAVDIVRTSGYALLDQTAQRAVGRWHFVAALEAGRPVSSMMLLKVRFVLTNPEGAP